MKTELDSLLGTEFLHVRKNLDFRPSIEYTEGHVYVEGSRRPTERNWEERAMVMVSSHDGRAHVGIYSEGARTIYSRAGEWSYLPRLFRAWARGALEFDDFRRPEEVVWIGREEEQSPQHTVIGRYRRINLKPYGLDKRSSGSYGDSE